jgi:elongation factor P
MIDMHEIKKGDAVLIDGEPYFVHDFKRAGTGQRKPVLHVKLRHVVTGSLTERTLTEKDTLEEPDLEKTVARFSYRSGDAFVFLDQRTYDPIEVKEDLVGDAKDLLADELEVRILVLDGTPVGVELPPSVTLEVLETPEPQKGAPSSRTSSVGKPAKLAGGIEVEVPLFIRKGEKIRISTSTREYLGKEKE